MAPLLDAVKRSPNHRACAGRGQLEESPADWPQITSAAKADVSRWKIGEQTGHKTDAMHHRYIRDADIFVGNAAGSVL